MIDKQKLEAGSECAHHVLLEFKSRFGFLRSQSESGSESESSPKSLGSNSDPHITALYACSASFLVSYGRVDFLPFIGKGLEMSLLAMQSNNKISFLMRASSECILGSASITLFKGTSRGLNG